MNAEAERIVTRLGLAPLPLEGGFFRQTWVSRERLARGRPAGSAILFLLTPRDFSALHRLKTGEIWHFCSGDPVEHVQLDPRDGSARLSRLGPAPLTDTPQVVVPGGVWHGARVASGVRSRSGGARRRQRGWALLACTMSPAWAEKEFTLGRKVELIRAFPAQAALIGALVR
jgi:predicted cupin superfamily sugar epimerase